MSLMKVDPMFPMSTSIGKMFDDFFNQRVGDYMGSTSTLPSVNIVETADSYELEIAAPGMEREDFDVNVEENTLTISAEKSQKNKEEDENYLRREFNYTIFKRSFNLPQSIDADDINAKYQNGVLKLVLPKKEEAKEKPPRTIEIA